MIEISVIIPCYNHGKYLDQAVESILNQSFKNLEIIIINDGSTDEFTNELLSNYPKPKTSIIHLKNSGPAIARNIAIEKSQGKYIFPLDADDYIEETYLEKAFQILENSPKIGIVGSWFEEFEMRNARIQCLKNRLEDFVIKNGVLNGALYRKICWIEAGGYDPKLTGSEDWDFWIQILKNKWSLHIIPEYLYFYRILDDSRERTASRQRIEVMMQIVSKHIELFKDNIIEVIRAREQEIANLNEACHHYYSKTKELEKGINDLKKSRSYRLMQLFLHPFKKLRSNA